MHEAPAPVGPRWRKSSYSNAGNECVEVAQWRKASYSTASNACVEVAQWRKASYSTASNQCVEVGRAGAACGVRDSKDPAVGPLVFGAAAWQAFLTGIKGGRYDR